MPHIPTTLLLYPLHYTPKPCCKFRYISQSSAISQRIRELSVCSGDGGVKVGASRVPERARERWGKGNELEIERVNESGKGARVRGERKKKDNRILKCPFIDPLAE